MQPTVLCDENKRQISFLTRNRLKNPVLSEKMQIVEESQGAHLRKCRLRRRVQIMLEKGVLFFKQIEHELHSHKGSKDKIKLAEECCLKHFLWSKFALRLCEQFVLGMFLPLKRVKLVDGAFCTPKRLCRLNIEHTSGIENMI